MNKYLLCSLSAAFSLGVSAFAAAPDSYQVTGPVLELTDTKIVVEKNKERWEIARTADTKVTGELKVGAKVTIEYSMTAKTVEVKGDKAKTDKPATPEKKAADAATKKTN
jgi:hypothetical protein